MGSGNAGHNLHVSVTVTNLVHTHTHPIHLFSIHSFIHFSRNKALLISYDIHDTMGRKNNNL